MYVFGCMYVCMYVCMYECISPLLPRFQVIEIEAISCFVQKATFSRKQVNVARIPTTKADLFLRIFEPISGTLKRFETL